jgi:hypothetical protein
MSSETLHELRTIRRAAIATGLIALGFAVLYGFVNPTQFYRSYLFSYVYWLGFAAGCLPLLALTHLIEGRWGRVIRRQLEAGLRTIMILALLFIPVLAGVRRLYPWASQDLGNKSVYLNIPFFTVRAVAYFAIWGLFAWILARRSASGEQSGDERSVRKLQLLSGPAILAYALAITFASIDWVMSLEPGWFSTIYGILFMTGQALTALAFVVVVATAASRPLLAGAVTDSDFHDLGNLLLAFVSLWAYVSFSQYLIIWSGNLPEEVTWYHSRTGTGWKWLAAALILFHFAAPFVLLLSRKTKRSMAILRNVAIAILVARALDIYWMVTPAFKPDGSALHWLDPLLLIGIGGVWLAMFLAELRRSPPQALEESGS